MYSIGNADHLDNRPAGGHTPWRDGSPVGVVWAIDIMVDHEGAAYLREFEKFVVSYCKSNADTTAIRFFNLNGSQYKFNGIRKWDSSDRHFHLEIENGKQNATLGLMAAWKAHKFPAKPPTTPKPVPPAPEISKEKTVFLVRRSDGAVYKTDGFRAEHVPGPSSRAGYKDLVKALGEPIPLSSEGEDFGVPKKESK